MRRQMGVVAGSSRWVWLVALVLVAAAGASDAKTKSKKDANQGYIGIYMQELEKEVREGLDLKVEKGVLVSGVEEDSPADESGIDDGDVIISFDGKPVSSADELRRLVRGSEPGTAVDIEVVRDGETRTVKLTVGERPEAPEIEAPEMNWSPREFEHAFATFAGPRLGVETHELENEELASYFGAKPGEGVLVLDVEEKSVAGEAGVEPGDVINEIGDTKISSVDDLREAIRDYEEGNAFDITVLRRGKSQTLKATMDEQDQVWNVQRHFKARPGMMRAPRAFAFSRADTDELRKELDELREEIEELKAKLERQED